MLPGILERQEDVGWSSDEMASVLLLLTRAQEIFAHRSYAEVISLSNAIRADLSDAMAGADDGATRACIDGARFLCALVPMQATMARGLHGDCYGWTLGAISRDHDPNSRVNHATYGLPPFDGASDSLNGHSLANLTTWITVAFLLARKFGGLDAHARDFYVFCVGFCFGEIVRDPAEVDRPIEALVAVANWAVDRSHPDAEHLTRTLRRAYDDLPLEPRTRIRLATLFTTRAGFWTDLTPRAWAEKTLAENRADLVEHEVVQMLAMTVDTPRAWHAGRAEVLAEIRRLADTYRRDAETGMAAAVALESRFSILHPLIFNLTAFGSTDDLMDVLWAWYGRDGWERADGDVLFIGSAHGGQVAYVWPSGRGIVDPVAGDDSLEAVLVAVSSALNDYHRGPGGDRAVPFDERLAGSPALEHGPLLERRTREHYRLDLLPDLLPAGFEPRAFVVVPAHRDPVQAMMDKALGRLIPLEATLARAKPQRSIGTVGLWPGETFHTDAEAAVIEAVAQRSGWRVKRHAGPLDEAGFQRFYEDPEADVLWVIGHGEQSPYEVEATGLVLGDGSLLPIERIAGFVVPEGDRRLLVLNICSSGATQTSGGIARIGLGHALASPDQAVVAHLWPIDHYAALAFGSLLAIHLASAKACEAMARSLRALGDRDAALEVIEAVSPDLEAARRLAGVGVREHLENVLSWGCPVILT